MKFNANPSKDPLLNSNYMDHVKNHKVTSLKNPHLQKILNKMKKNQIKCTKL